MIIDLHPSLFALGERVQEAPIQALPQLAIDLVAALAVGPAVEAVYLAGAEWFSTPLTQPAPDEAVPVIRRALRTGIPTQEGPYTAVAIPVLGMMETALAVRCSSPSKDLLLHVQTVTNMLSSVFVRMQSFRLLRERDAKAQSILETTVDAIITIDERGKILSFNRAAERIFGFTPEEVIGTNVSVLMPEPFQQEHDEYLHRYLRTGEKRIIGIGREVKGKRKDGSLFPMDLSVSEVNLPDKRLFTGIVRDISQRRGLEQEVLRMSDLERRRIGQDLHDGLGQMLTGIGLIANGLARRLESKKDNLAPEMAEIAAMVREADQYARALARGLVPVEIELGGLNGALERLSENAQRLFGISCSLSVRGTYAVEDLDVAMHIYRIAQEAVSNAVRHGRADTVRIVLSCSEEQIRLRVQDNGSGFVHDPHDLPNGMGLRIMHYRANILGGTLEIRSIPGSGTTVTCTVQPNLISLHSSPASSEAPTT